MIQEVRKREAYEKPSVKRKKNQKQLANVSLSKLPEFVLVRKSGLLARFFIVSGVLEDYGYFQADCHERARYRADPPIFCHSWGARAVLLDVDNTIASYTSTSRSRGAVQWAQNMVEAGFRVMIVSNNFKKRVEPFARRFGLDCISFAMKPLPAATLRPESGCRCPAGNASSSGIRFLPM